MALSESDRRSLDTWRTTINYSVPWRLLQNHRPESDLFAEFLKSFQELIPQVQIMTEEVPETELPGLILGENWHFHAVPEGKKLEMLKEILLALDGQESALPPGSTKTLGKTAGGPGADHFHCPLMPLLPPDGAAIDSFNDYPAQGRHYSDRCQSFYRTLPGI